MDLASDTIRLRLEMPQNEQKLRTSQSQCRQTKISSRWNRSLNNGERAMKKSILVPAAVAAALFAAMVIAAPMQASSEQMAGLSLDRAEAYKVAIND